jgi:hypothetical protein
MPLFTIYIFFSKFLEILLYYKDQNMYSWHKLSKETNKAFAAFEVFRDLGNKRSIKKITELSHSDYEEISAWSEKFNWLQRTIDYDLFIGNTSPAKENIKDASGQKIISKLQDLLDFNLEKLDLLSLSNSEINDLDSIKIIDSYHKSIMQLRKSINELHEEGESTTIDEFDSEALDFLRRDDNSNAMLDSILQNLSEEQTR